MKKQFALLVISGLAATLYAASPYVGTWKLNLAKSKYSDPAPKSVTLTVLQQGDILDVTAKGTAADGSPISVHYTVPEKGGTQSFTEGAPPAGVIATSKGSTDGLTVDIANTMNGKEIQNIHGVVSKDLKMMRLSWKGTDPQGKPYKRSEVYEKQ